MQELRSCLYSQNNTKHNDAITYLIEYKGYVSGIAHLIVDGFEKGLDINKYSDKSLTYDQVRAIKEGLESGVDLTAIFSKKTKSCILDLALKLLQDGRQLPEDLTEERNASEVNIMWECLELGITYRHYLQNNVLIRHADLINSLVKQYPGIDIIAEFSWVEDSMSEEYVKLVYKAKKDTVWMDDWFKYDLFELHPVLEEAYRVKIDNLYSEDRLKKCTVFDDFCC